MAAQFEGFDSYTRQFADTTRLAMENAESAFGLQLQAFGENVNATTGLMGEFASVSSLDSYQALWPKSLQLARDNLERLASASQEVVGMSLKASDAIGQMARHQFESVSERWQAAAAKPRKGKRAS